MICCGMNSVTGEAKTKAYRPAISAGILLRRAGVLSVWEGTDGGWGVTPTVCRSRRFSRILELQPITSDGQSDAINGFAV